MAQSRIRNFSIIAHIDHGKSTLADRFIQMCGGLPEREMAEQVLDSMDLERERGITIKAQTAALEYKARNGEIYLLNLIDTPGHVDFSYEVSRSLAACEGAVLVVDASQGVEAQTVANCYTATEQGVEVIPVLNKIDLPSADPEKAIQEIEDVIGIPAQDAIRVSAKTGENVARDPRSGHRARFRRRKGDPACAAAGADHRLLVRQLRRRGDAGAGDGGHDPAEGEDRADEHRRVLSFRSARRLHAEGEAEGDARRRARSGYVTAGIKELRAAEGRRHDHRRRTSRRRAPLPGFKEIKPQVFAGLYPVEANEYEALREALEKLHLNDASFHYEPETSQALGFGFRCGFLGLLHMDIVQERLEREYGMHLITTAPSVVYEVKLRDGTLRAGVESVAPAAGRDDRGIPRADHGVQDLRAAGIRRPGDHAVHREARHADQPALLGAPRGDLVRPAAQRGGARLLRPPEVDDARLRLARLRVQGIPRRRHGAPRHPGERRQGRRAVEHGAPLGAQQRGRDLVTKLSSLIPRQMFDVAIQAAIGGHIIARENVKALRKNVIAKCYGGDITRKRKLLDKQKEGKKRMKQVGSVEIPQEAFLAVLQRGER